MLTQGFCIRRAHEGDAEAISALMNRAFDLNDGQGGEFAPDWWRWKYSANPSGHHSLVCEGPGGALLGHYGGVPAKVLVDDQVLQFGQNCDSCTDPTVRRGLRKPGMFVRLGQAYASTFAIPGQDAVMYGLPVRKAYRIGARYLDYWMLREQLALRLGPNRSIPTADPLVHIAHLTAFPEDLEPFLRSVRRPSRCHAERSLAFLRWRFECHPRIAYEFAVARRTGVVTGYAVFAFVNFWGQRMGALMDLGCEPEDRGTLGSLLNWACARTGLHQGKALVSFWSPASPWFAALQRFGCEVVSTDYVLAARPYHPSLDPEFLRTHWSYSLADFDIL